jgi:xylulokinase
MAEASGFLCVDIGTSSMKGAVFSPAGELLRFSRLGFPVEYSDSFSNWNADAWTAAFRRLAAELGCPEPEGIVISGNGPSLVPLGKNGKPVFSALLWIDPGSVSVAGQPSLFLPKALWLMEKKPEVYEKTAFFLGCPEYLVYCLSGEKCAFSPSTEFSPFIWTAESCAAFGLDVEKFPPHVRTAGLAGRVGERAARVFGFLPGTPIYSAGPDFLMALLGTAAVRPGLCCDRAGTSEGVNVCSQSPAASPKLRCLPHVIPGLWNAAVILPPTGRLFEWFRRVSGQKNSPYDETLGAILEEERASADTPAFFPFKDGAEGGVFTQGGKRFSAREILSRCGKKAAGLAVIRAIGFLVRRALADLEAEGFPVQELRVCGGQAKSPLWNACKANLTGKTLRVPAIPDAELVGGLAVCLRGRGDYAGLEEASRAVARFAAEYRPDAEKKEYYNGLYEEWAKSVGRSEGVRCEE